MANRSEIDLFMAAISSQESGGSYTIVNKGSGAYGRFQIMPSNWPSWAAEAGLGAGAPRSSANQDIVARFKMLQYFDQYGSWEAVAVAWFAGPSRAQRYVNGDMSVLNLSDGSTTVAQYIAKMQRGMASLSGTVVAQGAGLPVPFRAPAAPAIAVHAVSVGVQRRPVDFTPGGKLGHFDIATNTGVAAEISQAVIGTPTLEMTMDLNSELKLQVADPQLTLLAKAFPALTQLRYMEMDFEVVAVEVSGEHSPVLDVSAQPLGVMFLKRATGELVLQNISPTTFAMREAQAAGLAFIGEPTPPLPQITRAAPTPGFEPGTSVPENSWDLLKQLAEAQLMTMFVSGNTLFFGRQTWMRARPGVAEWKVRYPKPKAGEVGVYTVPRCRHSVVAGAAGGAAAWATEIEFSLDPASGNFMRPGDRVKFRGVPTFEGTFLVTRVVASFDNGTPTNVTVINPTEKLPPADQPHNDAAVSFAGSGSAAENLWRSQNPGVATQRTNFIWPVTGRPSGSPSGDFGPRTPPIAGASSFHRGIDIGMPKGAPVLAADAGRISIARYSASAGNFIEVEHEYGYKTRYLHLSQMLVSVGQQVARGQTIGLVGSTGTSTSPHLHFEIWQHGQAVDPMPRLP